MTVFNSSFQTPLTDTAAPNALAGAVTAMRVIDPTEGEETALLEVDDPTNVQLDWQLTGVATPVVGGTWLVELFIDDVDGVGATSGSLGASGPIGITGGVSPLTFTHTFNIPANRVGVGLYQLSATINHSPVGNPNQLSEMIGFAQSLPIKFTTTVVETN
ncbi:MAG TPA: hypothetical protein VKI99_19440 [Candidatus Dormibacteraeota bacterium]|nr:hypothetical protein [Candidatus Dormibacteraeota bacterium]